jgi:hypothetical protein
MPDSSTGGYLAPAVTTPPTEDVDLDTQLQAIVVGIAGLDGTLVRPRWQPVPPKQPAPTVNWCAIGVVSTAPDDNSAIVHHPDGDGYDELQRHEQIDALASFYGPLAGTNAAIFRDGLWIAQNREVMLVQGFGLVSTDPALQVPELVNQAWIKRVDIHFRLNRIVSRTYQVLNLLSASGTIITEQGSVSGPQVSTEPWEAGE